MCVGFYKQSKARHHGQLTLPSWAVPTGTVCPVLKGRGLKGYEVFVPLPPSLFIRTVFLAGADPCLMGGHCSVPPVTRHPCPEPCSAPASVLPRLRHPAPPQQTPLPGRSAPREGRGHPRAAFVTNRLPSCGARHLRGLMGAQLRSQSCAQRGQAQT